MNYRGRKQGSYGDIRRLQHVHARRSKRAKSVDESLKAPLAKTPEQWLKQPNRFDIPDVDTPKPQRLTENTPNTDRLINKDNLNFSNRKNKEAYDQALKILDNANIPYYIGMQGGVYVLISDMEKAEKLIEKCNDIMFKTS